MEVRLLGGWSREVDFNRYYRPWKLDLRGAEIIREEFERESKRLVEEIVISFVFNDGLFKRKEKKRRKKRRRGGGLRKKLREIQRRNSSKNFFLLRSSRNAISLVFFSRPSPFRASFDDIDLAPVITANFLSLQKGGRWLLSFFLSFLSFFDERS